jgi:hypothetical protein
MRHGRVKAARKTLRFFQLHAGIKPPYNVLLDGTFLVAAVRQKVNLFCFIARSATCLTKISQHFNPTARLAESLN